MKWDMSHEVGWLSPCMQCHLRSLPRQCEQVPSWTNPTELSDCDNTEKEDKPQNEAVRKENLKVNPCDKVDESCRKENKK